MFTALASVGKQFSKLVVSTDFPLSVSKSSSCSEFSPAFPVVVFSFGPFWQVCVCVLCDVNFHISDDLQD